MRLAGGQIEYSNLVFKPNPIPTGGGGYKPTSVSKIIALEPNVGLTSDQAVNSSFSVVLRSKIKKIDQFGP